MISTASEGPFSAGAAKRFGPGALRLPGDRVGRIIAAAGLLLALAGMGTCLHLCFFAPKRTDPFAVETRMSDVQLPVMLGVKLATVTHEAEVGVDGPFIIEDAHHRLIRALDGLRPGPLRVRESGAELAGQALPAAFRILPERDGSLQFAGKQYRGSLLVVPGSGGLDAINEVELETYVRSCVGQEMSPLWPMEALKAQAVACRTYALEHFLRMQRLPSQLNLTSMAYQGVRSECSRGDQAVQDTAGIVLGWQGRVFESFFSSTCGGHTSSVRDVFGQNIDIPPLRGVACAYCTGTKYYDWEYEEPVAEFIPRLEEPAVQTIETISAVDLDPAGRCSNVLINGTVRVSATRVRRSIGYARIRSTLFTVEKTGERIRFVGHGWGHGVGMCQYGARAMADAGMTWHEILRHYYPETEFYRLD